MSAALLVADSGPLIALTRLEHLDLPARYFESVLVTATVWEEVTLKPGVDEAPRLASAANSMVVMESGSIRYCTTEFLRSWTRISSGWRSKPASATARSWALGSCR
jgi:hypothetical protein